MGVIGGKLGQGFENWRVFAENTDIEADAHHIELNMEGGFFKDTAMLLEEVTWHRGFPSSCATCTWTGNSTITPASLRGHSCSLVERRFYPS